ncbi:hypothetical protein BVRB_3g063330 [Beta vulgaris subsp. vulgaris]|nr:hypothetical protein BVRB_3g063330 [Beta vulgaris subsp. vulgaris]
MDVPVDQSGDEPSVEEDEGCDHSYVLKDDIGYVCHVCGVIQSAIETIFDYQYIKIVSVPPVACWVNVHVVGGQAGIIVLPWFSQAFPQANLSYQDIEALTKRTQDGGIEVVNAKARKGLATLSIAWENFKQMLADDVRIVSSLPSTVVNGPAKENQTLFEATLHSLDPPTLPWTGWV